ncbi:serine/threonine-protein kinase [Nonomuraea candida]|uniref:serine/threonine-protein kinase n=1 Tax=Nonomuraea candida TaxID=359159 RepID=UPI00069441A9|nr:serine/threonine-protein kinase [Nonomuraea candida]
MVHPLTPDDPAALGGYRLAGRIGEGGQGVVYLAHDGDGEPVAIKLLNTGDAATRARLARELDALESIASFCTARVIGVSASGARPYVVSEYVEGPSLSERVAARGPLRGGELERLVVGTATALAAIHAAGIVHRDFKPANVLLGPDGPRVVDFGIARADGAATMTSGLIGTPAYLAPEQIGGAPAGPASDVFAWAASMVYAATGTSPFGADTVPAVLHRVLHAEPDLSALPDRLHHVIASCLAKDPARRPTAAQLMVSLVNPRTPPQGVRQDTGPPPPAPAAPPARPQGGGHDGGPTGPRAPVETTGGARRGGRSRAGLAAVVVTVAVLGATGAAVLLMNRAPATDDDRVRPPVAATTDAGPSPQTSQPAQDPRTPPSSPTPEPSPSGSAPAGETKAGPGLEIPAAFEGKWSGHTTSTNPLDPDGAENTVDLEEGESTAAWEEKHDNAECQGDITLTKVESGRLTFSLGQNDGNCIPGTITLELAGDTLTYTWRDVPGLGLVTQTGTLKKN